MSRSVSEMQAQIDHEPLEVRALAYPDLPA